ncbi:metallophosphoesterase [Glutamicibacter sp. M10]|uniref:metallophosphoesterase family protein n=1 Tax=Glutamicibacter sp. M10 TaxID=3023076 RepID=UPI0021C98187|nr:metallophosphoesterase [Glutamicibacter sp. M10]UXN32850.1 metallophosphoesterase [Glutamicibacter sp. M10]
MKPLTVIHLSDTHLCRDGQLLHETIDSWQQIELALEAARAFSPDAIVLTGDIADRGAPIHSRAAKLFNEFQEELGCPVISIPGNHDPARSVGAEFNTRRLSTGPHPANTVHEVMGLRIIGLDSGGYQQRQGELDRAQLQWLESLLTVPAPRGSLLLIHHPPVEATSEFRAGRGLKDPMALAAVIAGSDIRAILCGHYHQAASSQLLNTPVFMAPAVSYNMNPFASDEVLEESGAKFALLQLGLNTVNWSGASSDQFTGMPRDVALPAPVSIYENTD